MGETQKFLTKEELAEFEAHGPHLLADNADVWPLLLKQAKGALLWQELSKQNQAKNDVLAAENEALKLKLREIDEVLTSDMDDKRACERALRLVIAARGRV